MDKKFIYANGEPVKVGDMIYIKTVDVDRLIHYVSGFVQYIDEYDNFIDITLSSNGGRIRVMKENILDIKLGRHSDEDKKVDNMVSHPNHYQSDSGLEVIDVIKAFTSNLTGFEAVATANVIKYICRWKKKNGIEDLEKAKQYLEFLIDDIKKEKCNHEQTRNHE